MKHGENALDTRIPRRSTVADVMSRQSYLNGHLATQADSIMSTPALTIPVDAPVAFAAHRLWEGGAHQLVAVDDHGNVVGMVSRADLVRVFRRTDADIRREIVDGVITRWLRLDASRIAVSVHEGIVVLSGRVESAADRRLLVELGGGVEGVIDVISAITVEGGEAAASGWAPA